MSEDEQIEPQKKAKIKKKESKATQEDDSKQTQLKKRAKSKVRKAASPKKKKGGKQPMIKEDTEGLLEYFKEQNRPFTVNYLKDTLFLKVSTLQKNIDQLVQRGDIVGKDIGSSKVYLVNQQLMPAVSQEELDQLSKELECKTSDFNNIAQANSRYQEQIKNICRQPKMDDIQQQIDQLSSRLNELRSKMNQYEDSQFQKASIDEVNEVEKAHAEMQQLCRKRKKIYNDAISTVLAESDLTVNQFETIVGIFRD